VPNSAAPIRQLTAKACTKRCSSIRMPARLCSLARHILSHRTPCSLPRFSQYCHVTASPGTLQPHGRVSTKRARSNEQSGNAHTRQGHETPRALFDRLLLHRLSRSRQCRLRRADDEPGSRPVADGVRLRRRHLLPRLLPVRGAVEPAAGTRRRAQVDRAHHVHVGPDLRRHGVYRR